MRSLIRVAIPIFLSISMVSAQTNSQLETMAENVNIRIDELDRALDRASAKLEEEWQSVRSSLVETLGSGVELYRQFSRSARGCERLHLPWFCTQDVENRIDLSKKGLSALETSRELGTHLGNLIRWYRKSEEITQELEYLRRERSEIQGQLERARESAPKPQSSFKKTSRTKKYGQVPNAHNQYRIFMQGCMKQGGTSGYCQCAYRLMLLSLTPIEQRAATIFVRDGHEALMDYLNDIAANPTQVSYASRRIDAWVGHVYSNCRGR